MAARVILLGLAIFIAAFSLECRAIDPMQFSKPELRQRYQALTEELRCPKCQNQDLADSDAPIASDLRHEIHKLLEKGYTDQQIRDYLVDRYGEFILYKPRFNIDTALLWLLPALGLLVGGAIVARILVGRARAEGPDDALTEADRQRLAKLLDGEQGEHR